MSEPESLESTPEGPPPSLRDGALRDMLGLFVVPLLVVVLCVSVFIGFGWVAYERRDVSDYLEDLRSSWSHRRWQAAYELSKVVVADPELLTKDPEAGPELRRLFAESSEWEDERVRRYLALVVGHLGDVEALPLLIEATEDSDAETRIYATWALGALGDAGGFDRLSELAADSDPGLRKTAAWALGQLGQARARTPLSALLSDEVIDVRWNAAISLAVLGDPASLPTLETMLDREFLAGIDGITPEQQEDALLAAIPALAALRGDEALPRLQVLEDSDPSRKVRQEAIKARRQLTGAE